MLTARQRRFYLFTVDLWRAGVLHTSGIPAALEPASSGSLRTPAVYGSDPIDMWKFELTTDIQKLDVIHVTSAPHSSPDLGGWWLVLEPPSRFARRANALTVPARRSTPIF